MTMGRTEFDGDSHTSVRYFLGMTRSDGSPNSHLSFSGQKPINSQSIFLINEPPVRSAHRGCVQIM